MKDVLKEQRNQKYNDYVKRVTPVHSLPLNMLKAFVTGGVIFPDPDFCQCDTHRSEYLSETCKVRRSRNAGADHWICQFGGSFCDRISERRAGFRDRMQDLYDCRTCDPVWDLLELGAGTDLLDLSGDCISNVR